MIGQQAFCLDPKTKKIFTAKIIGSNISETGYELIRLLLSDNSTKSLEKAHVYTTQEEAEAHEKRVITLLEQADQIIKETTEKIDAIRIKVIGEPVYSDIAEKIKGK